MAILKFDLLTTVARMNEEADKFIEEYTKKYSAGGGGDSAPTDRTGTNESENGTRAIYSLSNNIFFIATEEEANRLAQGLANVLNATYTIDENDNIYIDYCDLNFEKDESILILELRNRFENMKNEEKPLYLSFGDESKGWAGEFTINDSYLNNDFVKDIIYYNDGDRILASFESTLVHEFFGHGGEYLLNKYFETKRGVEQKAVIWENYWHIINNEYVRTRYGYPNGREISIPSWQLNWKKP